MKKVGLKKKKCYLSNEDYMGGKKMRKINLLVILVALTLLSACNVFEKLDKKSESRDVQEFEISEKMNSGDYSGVVSLVTTIINNDPTLKAIQNQSDIQSYLVANYSDATVQDYINLKTLEAEARLGLSNVKLSDILSEITKYTTPNQVSGNIVANTTSTELQIKDIIPPNVDTVQLALAVKAYVMGLPVDNKAYVALKDTFEQDYLSGALAIVLGTVNSALDLTATFENDDYTKITWADFQANHLTNWNNNAEAFNNNMTLALDILTIFAANSGAVSQEDIDKVKKDASAILATIKPFENETDFNNFLTAVGLN